MDDYDQSNKPTWFTDEAPRQPSPDVNLFGNPDIGKRSANDDLINPNLPVWESGLVLLHRARQAAAKQAAEGTQAQEGAPTAEAAPQAAPETAPASSDAPVVHAHTLPVRAHTLPVRGSGLTLLHRAGQAAAKHAAEGTQAQEGAPTAEAAPQAAPDPGASTSAHAAPVQRKATGAATDDHVHEAAQRGVAGSGSKLPYFDEVQRLFGAFNVSKIQAHTGEAAARATTEIGAEAYATGNHVAFTGVPDLRTAAHEAAHVAQQSAGVQLKGGVGEAGDAYERNADDVADRVVRGESAADLLPGGGSSPGSAARRADAGGGGRESTATPVQRAPAATAAAAVAAEDARCSSTGCISRRSSPRRRRSCSRTASGLDRPSWHGPTARRGSSSGWGSSSPARRRASCPGCCTPAIRGRSSTRVGRWTTM